MTRLQITLSERDGVIVAVLEGEIDASNVGSVAEQLFGAVSNDALGAVFDLSAVGYVDSAGVGLFFDAARRLAHRRQRLGLAVPESSSVHRLFEITKVSTVASVCPSVPECVEAVREQVGGGHR